MQTKLKLYALGLICSTYLLNAQEQLGLNLSNYQPANAIALNPAQGLYSPLDWDLNIFAGAAFLDNNYAYIYRRNTFDVLRGIDNLEYRFAENPSNGGVLEYDFLRNGEKKDVAMLAFVQGPSALVKRGQREALGLTTKLRAYGSLTDIPAEFGYYAVKEMNEPVQIDLERQSQVAAVWAEIGLNYERFLIKNRNKSLAVGISPKLLLGYDAAYFEITEPASLLLDNSSVTINEFKGSTGSSVENPKHIKGLGAGVDIGVIYTINEPDPNKCAKLGGHRDEDFTYKWKFGASLLDLGGIKYKDVNKQNYELAQPKTIDFSNWELNSLTDFQDEFQSNFVDISLNPRQDFSIMTPTGYSFQVERALPANFYINAVLTRNIKLPTAKIDRVNSYSLIARYEHRWIEATVPFTMYEGKDPHLGLALRLGFITIGTDNLLSWAIPDAWTGTDVYFALRYNPFQVKKRKRTADACPFGA